MSRALLRAALGATALAATALPGGCTGNSSPSTSSGSGSGTTGSGGGNFDAGCINNYCTRDAECCPGFSCNTVDQIDTCCELPGSGVPCLLDTDCCPIPNDAGSSSLPYCDSNQQCAPAPNCAGLESPCNVLPCCVQPGAAVICSPLNGTCTYATGATGSSTGGSTSGSSSGTSGGSGASSGTGGGATTGGSEFNWAFTWTFGINQACEQAGVSWVEVQLIGNTIGLFPCRDQNGTEGVTLPATPLTQDSYTLTGYNAAGNLTLAQATGTTPAAQGTTTVPVDLAFNDGGPSSLDLGWTFAGQSCAQAGVAKVQVTLVDPKQPALDVDESVACSSGALQGITLQGYGDGQFPLTLSATGSAGGYQATATIFANGLSDSLSQVDLLPVSDAGSGDVLVKFDFGGEGCVAAGLDSVGLQLSNLQGKPKAPAVVLLCDAGGSYAFTGVPAPTTAFLWVEGISQGQVQQLSNPQVVVSPGGTATYSVVTQLGN